MERLYSSRRLFKMEADRGLDISRHNKEAVGVMFVQGTG